METTNGIISGYYLLMTESGGKYDDYWRGSTRSCFIEKDGKDLLRASQIIEQILDEFDASLECGLKFYGMDIPPPMGIGRYVTSEN